MNKHFLFQEQTPQCTLSALPKFDSPRSWLQSAFPSAKKSVLRARQGLISGTVKPPLHGHPFNTDTSSLQTVWLVSGEKKPLNTDTLLIQTFSMAPLVSILTVFDCTYCLVTKRGNSYINYIVGMCGPKRCGLLKPCFLVKEITANWSLNFPSNHAQALLHEL